MPRTPIGSRACDACGEPYLYYRVESKFCSDTCRSRMYQAGSRRTRIPDSVRFSVLRRDEFACRYCGHMPDEGAELEVDHVVPVSAGGALTALANLVTSCKRCNNGKHDTVIEPWEVPPPRGHGSDIEDGADA